MKKLLGILLFGVMALQGFSQDAQTYKSVKDPEGGTNMLVGEISLKELQQPGYSWFKTGMDAYKPDSGLVKRIKQEIGAYEIVVFMGTWCDDSHTLVPQFFKVLKACDYPLDKVKIFATDRQKHTLNIEHDIFSISKVPTFIVYLNHNEVGRITENVEKSVELDLMKMFDVVKK